MTRHEIRVATKEDLFRWFKGPPPCSSRSLVLEIDGELEALCGVQTSRGEIVAFSHINPKARANKRILVEGLKKFRELVQQHRCVVAYADANEPTAPFFLEHVGFRHVGTSRLGEVYLYERNGGSSPCGG